MSTKLFGGIMLAGVLAFAGQTAMGVGADVVFIVDESGSMSGEHDFLDAAGSPSIIPVLDTALTNAGVTDNKFAIIGFGGGGSGNLGRTLAGLIDAGPAATAANSLALSGASEDGYAGIDFAFNNLSFRSGAAKNIILITDEGRDLKAPGQSFGGTQSLLESNQALLNVIVNATLSDGSNASALGIDGDGNAYLPDGSGGFTVSSGGQAISGSQDTITQYVDLALTTDADPDPTEEIFGAAWDLNQLRAGGLLADSFAASFVDIKVREIQQQDPPSNGVPVPAAAWATFALVGSLGGFKAFRRRKNA